MVEFFIEHSGLQDKVKRKLEGLGDMERTFQRVCVGGLSLQQRKAVLYDDVIKKRFLEFFALLDNLDTCYELIKDELGDYCKNNDVDLSDDSSSSN